MNYRIEPWTSPQKWRVYPAQDLRSVPPIDVRSTIPVDESMRWRLDGYLQAQLAITSPTNPGIYIIIAEIIIETALKMPQGTAADAWRQLNQRVRRSEGVKGDAQYANFCAIFMTIWHDIVTYAEQFDAGWLIPAAMPERSRSHGQVAAGLQFIRLLGTLRLTKRNKIRHNQPDPNTLEEI